MEQDVRSLLQKAEAGVLLIEDGKPLGAGELEAELASIVEQIEYHETRIGSYDPGTGEIAARDLPIVPVLTSQIAMHVRPPKLEGAPLSVNLVANGVPDVSEGALIATAEATKQPNGEIIGSFYLESTVKVDGSVKKVYVYNQVASENGVIKGVGEHVPLTKLAIDALVKASSENYGAAPTELGGSIIDQNRANFQMEYARRIAKGVPKGEALRQAAQTISYGKHRSAAGYTELEVTVKGNPEDWNELKNVTSAKDLTLLDSDSKTASEMATVKVPEKIEISARRPR